MPTIQDGLGREVTVTQVGGSWLYEGSGLKVELPARNDAKALESFNAQTSQGEQPVLPLVVPVSVPRRQAMAVLIKYGLDTTIESMLMAQLEAAGASGDASAILAAKFALNDYTESVEFKRDWPLIEKVRVAMAWPAQYVDALFIEARSM